MSFHTKKGTAAKPAISFNSSVSSNLPDNDTGLDSLADNQLDLIVGGTSVIQVVSTGLVNTGASQATVSTATTGRLLNGTSATAAGVKREFVIGPITCADNTATDIATVTVPNAANKAQFKLTFTASLGAGGAVGADESVRVGEYLAVVTRTAGAAAVVTLSTVYGAAIASVAGSATLTAAITATAMTGATSVAQTFKFQATLVKSGGASDSHKITVDVGVLNSNASGISIVSA